VKEDTLILQYLNTFNRILSDLLALEVKLEEENKPLLLLPSLPSSYDHLTTTIMYGKETLELEDVRQMRHNNELMKKADLRRMLQGWLSRAREEFQRVGEPKEIQRLLTVFLIIFARN